MPLNALWLCADSASYNRRYRTFAERAFCSDLRPLEPDDQRDWSRTVACSYELSMPRNGFPSCYSAGPLASLVPPQ
jgi:hypothetical protein